MIQGKGINIWADGRRYEGEYKDGNLHGKGIDTRIDGKKYEGGWKDWGMWNGTLYDTNGKILHKIVNGEIQSP